MLKRQTEHRIRIFCFFFVSYLLYFFRKIYTICLLVLRLSHFSCICCSMSITCLQYVVEFLFAFSRLLWIFCPLLIMNLLCLFAKCALVFCSFVRLLRAKGWPKGDTKLQIRQKLAKRMLTVGRNRQKCGQEISK